MQDFLYVLIFGLRGISFNQNYWGANGIEFQKIFDCMILFLRNVM